MLPVRLWMRQLNGNETTFEFTETRPNDGLKPESFEPKLIPGYSWKKD